MQYVVMFMWMMLTTLQVKQIKSGYNNMDGRLTNVTMVTNSPRCHWRGKVESGRHFSRLLLKAGVSFGERSDPVPSK